MVELRNLILHLSLQKYVNITLSLCGALDKFLAYLVDPSYSLNLDVDLRNSLSNLGSHFFPLCKCALAIGDIILAIVRDNLASLSRDDHESWQLADTVLALQICTTVLLGVWNGIPWHLLEVAIEVVWSTVIGNENDLDLASQLGVLIQLIVELFLEGCCEKATWWRPVSSKVESHVLALGREGLIECVEVNRRDVTAVNFDELITQDFLELIGFHFV